MKDAHAMLARLTRRQPGRSLSPRLDWFSLSAGTALAFSGAGAITEAFGKSSMIHGTEPVFGLPLRYFLLVMGTFQLLTSAICLLTGKKTLSAGLTAWVVTNYFVYRLCIAAMGWLHPWFFVGGLTESLNISPFLANCIHGLAGGYLLGGSLLVLWSRRVRRTVAPNMAAADIPGRLPSTSSNAS